MYHPPSTALMPCASTVAMAAPRTPRPSGPIKAISSPMFSTLLNSRKNSGVMLLPTACSMADSRLYAMVSGMPSRMTAR